MRSKNMKKLTKQEAVKRAVKFILSLPHIQYDESDIENMIDTSKYRKPYFVHVDSDQRGVWESNVAFASKREVNELIRSLLEDDNTWDHLYILDVRTNKKAMPSV